MCSPNKDPNRYLNEAWLFLRSKGIPRDPHGEKHVDRVMRICKCILEREGGVSEVVYMAAILHDIGKNEGGNHADKSAEIASNFLERIGYPEDKLESVVKAIREHSYSAKRKPSFKESMILSDADKLDALGAVGIARVFMESALRGRDIEEAMRHFHEKILKLPRLMYTETGRKMASEKIVFVEEFISRLRDELSFLRSIKP